MSLLDIAQRVADEVGLPRPAAVAAGTDQLARQMFALANTVLEDLGRMNWPALSTSFSFPTIVDQDAYAAPADYGRSVTDTAFLADVYYQMRGALSANEWGLRKNNLPSTAGRYRYRLFGQPLKIHIVPVPSLVQTVTIEYMSNLLALDADGVTGKPIFVADTDTPIVPEDIVRKGLKWRIKHAKGLDYSEDFNAYEMSRDQSFAQALGLGSTPVAQRSYADIPELGNGYIPDTGFGI